MSKSSKAASSSSKGDANTALVNEVSTAILAAKGSLAAFVDGCSDIETTLDVLDNPTTAALKDTLVQRQRDLDAKLTKLDSTKEDFTSSFTSMWDSYVKLASIKRAVGKNMSFSAQPISSEETWFPTIKAHNTACAACLSQAEQSCQTYSQAPSVKAAKRLVEELNQPLENSMLHMVGAVRLTTELPQSIRLKYASQYTSPFWHGASVPPE